MATNTYVALDTQTLGSAAASVTFSSIPQTYTDLVIIMQGKSVNSADDPQLYFNSDTGSNYSLTAISGNGSAESSFRYTNVSGGFYCGIPGWTSSGFTNHIVNIMNYANTTTNKTILSRNWSNENAAGYNATNAVVGLWRSTSAITSITLKTSGAPTFSTGSTATLYGILKA